MGGQSYAAKITNVTINWSNPVTNTDGTTLTNLSGIEINWGTCNSSTIGNIIGHIDVPDIGNITKYIVVPSGMSQFPICFTLRAYNTTGNYSVYSSVVEKNIPTLNKGIILGFIINKTNSTKGTKHG